MNPIDRAAHRLATGTSDNKLRDWALTAIGGLILFGALGVLAMAIWLIPG